MLFSPCIIGVFISVQRFLLFCKCFGMEQVEEPSKNTAKRRSKRIRVRVMRIDVVGVLCLPNVEDNERDGHSWVEDRAESRSNLD